MIKSLDLLLDVHSFPNEETWRLGRAVELVVLDNSPGESKWQNFAARLRALGINVGYVIGSSENDIVVEARGSGVASVILEFNESLSSERLNEICATVVAELA